MTDWVERYKEDMRIAALTEGEWKAECEAKFRKGMPWWVPNLYIRIFFWSADVRNWKQFVYKFPVLLIVYMLALAMGILSIPFYFLYAYYLILSDIYRTFSR